MPSSKYQLILRITLFFIVLTILAGSIVRSTGSGMGCPDWPKCFGQLIPPTTEQQLPLNYKEHYVEKRKVKIEKFARLLDLVGLKETAKKLKNDQGLLIAENFNVFNTYTEYINRLIGAIAGLFVLITLIGSIFYFKFDKSIFFLSLLNTFLIALTAWFGSVVVSTNLTPWVISIHMALAVLLMLIQIKIIVKTNKARYKPKVTPRFKLILILLLLGVLIQLFMGVKVRQEVDVVAENFNHSGRENWMTYFLNGNGPISYYYIHRSFSILLLIFAYWLYIKNKKESYNFNFINLTFYIIIAEIIVGIVLSYAGFPAFAQPIHLLLSMIILGSLYYTYLKNKKGAV